MTIPAISALTATMPTVGIAGAAAPSGADAAAAGASTGSSFASMLDKGLNAFAAELLSLGHLLLGLGHGLGVRDRRAGNG